MFGKTLRKFLKHIFFYFLFFLFFFYFPLSHSAVCGGAYASSLVTSSDRLLTVFWFQQDFVANLLLPFLVLLKLTIFQRLIGTFIDKYKFFCYDILEDVISLSRRWIILLILLFHLNIGASRWNKVDILLNR